MCVNSTIYRKYKQLNMNVSQTYILLAFNKIKNKKNAHLINSLRLKNKIKLFLKKVRFYSFKGFNSICCHSRDSLTDKNKIYTQY